MSKYNRTYHLPWSPGSTNDDRISDGVESLLGKDIVITEKLDGENCGMTDDGVYARSHATFTTSPWSREVRQLHKVSVEGQLGEGVYLFGENMENLKAILNMAFNDPTNPKNSYRHIVFAEETVRDDHDRVSAVLCKAYFFREDDKALVLEVGRKNSIGIA